MGTLKRRLPPLTCLVAFDAACRHGSFSRAADELGSTQSAVSRQIKQLEDFYGTQLFERRHRDVVVAEPGRYLAEVVSATLNEIALASDRIRMTRNSENVFRIRVEAEHAYSSVVPHLPELGRIYPDVHFDVAMTSEPLDIRSVPFDIGFHTDPAELKYHTRTQISDDWIVPVCSPDYAKSLPSPCTGLDLINAQLIHYQNIHRHFIGWREYLAAFDIILPEDNEGPTFSQVSGSLTSAEHGGGIALGWFSQAKARLESGRLVRVTDLCMHVPEGLAIYTDDRSRAHPLTAPIIRFFQKRINLSLGKDQYRAR